MTERSRDSSRDLLEELEDGWATPRAPAAMAALAASTDGRAPADVEAPAADEPDLAKVDEGWLDDLFPGDEDEDEDEEAEAEEPELPDERLDPEAYAAAKKAREERAASRRDKKKAKSEARRARQKARVEANRQKQKAKRPRAGRREDPPARDRAPASSGKLRVASSTESAKEQAIERAPERASARTSARASGSRKAARRKGPSTAASIRLLAIVLATLLALAAAVAAIVK